MRNHKWNRSFTPVQRLVSTKACTGIMTPKYNHRVPIAILSDRPQSCIVQNGHTVCRFFPSPSSLIILAFSYQMPLCDYRPTPWTIKTCQFYFYATFLATAECRPILSATYATKWAWQVMFWSCMMSVCLSVYTAWQVCMSCFALPCNSCFTVAFGNRNDLQKTELNTTPPQICCLAKVECLFILITVCTTSARPIRVTVRLELGFEVNIDLGVDFKSRLKSTWGFGVG